MAQVSVNITVDNSRPTLKLEAIQKRIGTSGMVAFMQGFAAPILQASARARFEEQGDEATGPWRPLLPATVARRTKAGQTPIRINDRTGQMRAWVENAQGRTFARKGSAVFEWPGTPSNRLVGQKLKTAQLGKGDPRTVPRPVIAISAEDRLALQAAIRAWVGAIP